MGFAERMTRLRHELVGPRSSRGVSRSRRYTRTRPIARASPVTCAVSRARLATSPARARSSTAAASRSAGVSPRTARSATTAQTVPGRRICRWTGRCSRSDRSGRGSRRAGLRPQRSGRLRVDSRRRCSPPITTGSRTRRIGACAREPPHDVVDCLARSAEPCRQLGESLLAVRVRPEPREVDHVDLLLRVVRALAWRATSTTSARVGRFDSVVHRRNS